ncbi:MAG: hypothetical protein JSV18_04115 [Candidatus Bathyarchaeota archaeon]|nr:MAG: hypothetical protein JSV18_04115 [Candidatus Bathyarchaeota archaeon]
MSSPEFKLVFVYNADSGLYEAMVDGLRKLVAPMTQACRLCALTYQVAWMRPAWSRFVRSLSIQVEFLHRDEFKERYGDVEVGSPSAFIDRGGDLEPFISSDEMNATETLDDLMNVIRDRLNERGLG